MTLVAVNGPECCGILGGPMLPKYALNEHERRWLVETPAWRAHVRPFAHRLVDRYLDCGRLRVRLLTRLQSGEVVRKLTKKYPWTDSLARPLTTMYLTEEEHAAFAGLPGRDLVKVRHFVEHGDRVWGVDVFEGPLAGLVIAECECDSREAVEAITPPDWAGREITGEPRYACAALAANGLPG